VFESEGRSLSDLAWMTGLGKPSPVTYRRVPISPVSLMKSDESRLCRTAEYQTVRRSLATVSKFVVSAPRSDEARDRQIDCLVTEPTRWRICDETRCRRWRAFWVDALSDIFSFGVLLYEMARVRRRGRAGRVAIGAGIGLLVHNGVDSFAEGSVYGVGTFDISSLLAHHCPLTELSLNY
jgi:hypothetical protein